MAREHHSAPEQRDDHNNGQHGQPNAQTGALEKAPSGYARIAVLYVEPRVGRTHQADRAGLVRDPVARHRLQSLMRHLESDRSLLKHAEFFDGRGLRLKIEETAPP